VTHTRRITIPYTPRALFRQYHGRTQRWACLVCHRRMGKTVAAINDKVRRAVQLTLHDGRYAYVAPQLNQAKDVAWNYLKRYTEPLLIEKNEAELWVEIPNAAGHRSRVRIYGADNPDRLRGGYLDGVTEDEYADIAPSVHGEIIRPMLADRRGWATFIGTLKGRNHLWKLHEDHKNDPEWFTMLAKASETGIIPPEELTALRADMTPEEYEQEFECNPDAAIRGAYFGKELATAQDAGRIGPVPWDEAVPVHTAWDLGIGDATAIWFFQIVGAEIHVIDHYEAHGHGLPHYAQVLASKPYKYGRHYLPHDARARDLGTGRTRVETFQKLTGAAPWVLRPNNVMDGINAARLTLARCWFDAVNCADGLEALRQYRADFDEKARTFKDAPRHDWTSHSADAFRYLAMAWRELKPEVKPPEPQWFTRGAGSAIQVNIGAITQRHHARRRREDD
jgi:phage terminase large subunit